MATKMFNQKQKDQLITDLKECESIKEDIEKAKKAGVQGIEILEARYQDCLKSLTLLNQEYGGRHN